MKMKKQKLVILSLLSLGILGGMANTALARDVIEIKNFRVTSNGSYTPAAKKYTSSNTVINLQQTGGGKRVDVDNYSTGGKWVGSTTCWTNTRKSFSDNSAPGGLYNLKLSNKKWGQDNFSVTGSWSPDSY